MKTINLVQGSADWHAHRLHHFNASDAPAMMGVSPYKTRAALIRELATGLGEDVSPEKQRLFDAGHRFEALARPLAEQIIGEELSPVVGAEGKLSASFDGLTFMGDVAFEHKTLNADLRAAIRQQGGNANNFLAPAYLVQMEQQCLVSGCERILFMASKWDGDTLVEERHCWYTPDPELRAQIVAGWEQLEKDVAAYQPPIAAPTVIAEPVQALPAISVVVSGEIAIRDNLKIYEVKVREFLDEKLIREPKTDQDFVDLGEQIKMIKEGRDAIKGAIGQVLGGVESVDITVKTLEMLDGLLQKAGAASERTLTTEKDRRKTEIVTDHQNKLRDHVADLTKRVGVQVTVAADFAGVIKGLKSLASMEDKLSVELARAKIAASGAADLIDANRKAMTTADAVDLFPDFSHVCTKPADDFANLVTSRKTAAEAAQAARLAAKQKADEAAAAPAPVATTVPPSPAPAPEVRTFRRVAAPALATEEPTLSLGRISGALGFTVTADLLARLGFSAHVVKAARLYRPSQFPAIKQALVDHINSVPDEVPLAA